MQVGPIDDLNGFPLWYKDANGLRLQLNADPADPYSGISFADLPDPLQPVSFPENFPGESFYYLAEAEMRTGNGERARLVLALEATFVNEEPTVNEQIVFGRVRIRVAGLQPDVEYKVSHPFGVDTFIPERDRDGLGEINFTEDIGGMNGGDFELALKSRVFPFLQWDSSIAPAAPPGYIGDPNTPHPIEGSIVIDEFGQPQNYFRIEGPGIGIGSPDRSTTPGLNPDNCIETRNFALQGKVATISGVEVPRATYSQDANGGGMIDVFAISDDAIQHEIVVSGTGVTTSLLKGLQGMYFTRAEFIGENPPTFITVINTSDNPATSTQALVVDFIQATANFDIGTNSLTIEATSSDSIDAPILSIADFGHGELVIPSDGLTMNITSPPHNVTIRSTAGGERTIPVTITGSSDQPINVRANAGENQTVQFGTTVTLNGSNSSGPITAYSWTQLSGTEVTLLNADTVNPSFIAPLSATTLTFELTVDGEGGPSTDTVTITVNEVIPPPVVNPGLTVTRAEFRTRDAEWRITGTSDVIGTGAIISIHIGNSVTGPLLAEVVVEAIGDWSYRIEGSNTLPDQTRAISIQSTSGASILNIPLNIRQ